jgi:3-hydroxyisobutyrate dehydrogenase-like beta-hydroxyacid dehydrogenase
MGARVGVLGLGSMGAVLARRLLEADVEVRVHNRSAERAASLLGAGAGWAADADDLADTVDLLITMVADDDALLAVTTGAGGLLRRPHPGLVYADLSTVSPATSAVVAEAAAAVGVSYLRSPVSGSTVLAASGALSVLASGSRVAFDAFTPVFDVLARRTFFLGSGEEARVMKLALNTLVGLTVVGLSEALVFGERCGLEWGAMLEVFADSAVSSPLVKYKATTLLERDFEAAFTTAMMTKDLDLALSVGRRHGAVMPTTALTSELLRATGGSGWADHDFSASVLLFEQLSGTAVAGTRADGMSPTTTA